MEQDEQSKKDNLWLAEAWLEHRARLARLLSMRIPAVLLRRFGVDDLLQDAYLSCGRRMSFLQTRPEIPIYVKLRLIALQTLTDLERMHLQAGKRDAMKECDLYSDDESVRDVWERFADSITSPRTRLVKMERQAFARRVLAELSAHDREILELRHFEELSNNECAAVLEIAPKASSIRYVRALKRFQVLVSDSSLFER